MNKTNLTHYRYARDDDAEIIAKVLLASFIEYKNLYTAQGFSATTPNSSAIRDRMKEGPVWLALLDGVVVGTASGVLKDNSLYVRGMAVLPAARGEGIANALLEQIERYGTEYSCERLFLSTTPFLSSAIRLYERYGFRRTEDGEQDLFGTPLFTMEKIVKGI